MKYRQLGRTGEKVSELVLGAWTLGDGNRRADMTDEGSIATIHAAIDAGMNFIDTAEIYGDGRSEEIIGRALKGRRGDMMIATKVWRDNLTRDGIERSLTKSLKRLQTDYVDVYQIHRPSDTVPIEESMEKLAECQKEGRIRYIGVSNFSAKQMAEAMKVARFETSQPPYNLFWRFVEDEDLPYCVEEDISVIPWSPLGQGILSGKFTPQSPLPEGDGRRNNFVFMEPTFPIAGKAIERLRVIAGDHKTSVPELTLAWLLTRPAMTAPIVGPRYVEQVEGLLGAVELKLSDDVIAEITAIGDTVMASLRKVEALKNVYEMWP